MEVGTPVICGVHFARNRYFYMQTPMILKVLMKKFVFNFIG